MKGTLAGAGFLFCEKNAAPVQAVIL